MMAISHGEDLAAAAGLFSAENRPVSAESTSFDGGNERLAQPYESFELTGQTALSATAAL